MRNQEVDAAAVNVQRFAEIALGHRRAFDGPARTAMAEVCIPRRPEILIARLRLLPQREVADRLLVVPVSSNSGAGTRSGAVEVSQRAVTGKAADSEVHVAFGGLRESAGAPRRDHRH